MTVNLDPQRLQDIRNSIGSVQDQYQATADRIAQTSRDITFRPQPLRDAFIRVSQKMDAVVIINEAIENCEDETEFLRYLNCHLISCESLEESRFIIHTINLIRPSWDN